MKQFLCAVVLFFAAIVAKAQLPHAVSPGSSWELTDSLFYLTGAYNCKSFSVVPFAALALRKDSVPVTVQRVRVHKAAPLPVKRDPLLVVHGNVMYDFYYQSNSDTPFVEKDLHQHTLQTTLDVTVRNQYPLHLTFSTAQGNSAYFRNITGVNLKYTSRDFRNMLIGKAQQWDAANLKQLKQLDTLRQQLEARWAQLNALKSWFAGGSVLQRRVELREYEYYKQNVPAVPNYQLPEPKYTVNRGKLVFPPWADTLQLQKPSLPAKKNDSIILRFRDEYAMRELQLDSLQKMYTLAEELYRLRKQQAGNSPQKLAEVLTQSRNNRELSEQLEAMHLPDTVLPKGYRSLLAVKSFGIGRSLVDYSELTVKNISVTGVQVEYNPSYYLAFATGAVDYRFRDFVTTRGRVKQYVSILRAGLGMRDGNNLIFSFYTGKKQIYNFNTITPGNDTLKLPDYRVMGISLEGRWQLGKNICFTAEAAKSSMPYYQRTADNKSIPGSMLQFNDHSNEAYAVTGNAFIPRSGTRLNVTAKKMGASFQSFSLYNSGSSQLGWMVRADQPFFKQQLTVTGTVRKNVFNSLLEHSGYESNTVFASLQATFRRRNWPVVTVGYAPTSQVMKIDDDRFVENMFYTFNGTISHFYTHNNVSMNTMLAGTRFYNKQNDSNFVYFNSTNIILSHTVFLGRLTVNGGLSSVLNAEYNLHGAEGNVQYRVGWFDIGGGLKYNYQGVYHIRQLGYTGNVSVKVPKLGEIGVMGDRGFIPGINKRLVPNETGRLTYTRIF